MFTLAFLIKGIIFGFSIAAPVGPVGILCIRRTLESGRLVGFISGLGASVAIAIYGAVAALGLSALSEALMDSQFWLSLFGGLVLIYLGIRIFFTQPVDKTKGHVNRVSRDLLAAFLLTMVNPMTIVPFLAFFPGLGFHEISNHMTRVLLVSGIFVGSVIWWLILSNGVALFRKKMNQKILKWINRVAGLLIVFFGVVAIFS